MDELNLICHPPLEVTEGNTALKGGEDVIGGGLFRKGSPETDIY